MKVSAWGTLLFLAWAPLVVVADGCSTQHEGERCDKTNGDLDCGAGLQCKRVYVEDYHWLCCPIPPAKATIAACNASSGPPPVVSDSGADADAMGGAAGTAGAAGAGGSSGTAGSGGASGAANDAGDAVSDGRAENDAAGEAGAGGAPNDTLTDIAVDMSVDMATPDAEVDTVPTDDATTDADDDVSSDVASDAEDVADAPTSDGPG
jgi:hypothetical protein